MSFVIGANFKESAYAVVNGKKKVVTKNIRNFDFADGMNIKTSRFSTSGKTDLKYNAFPYFVNYGTYSYGIYSEGGAHGNSDRQIMIRTSKSSDGQSFQKVVFFENSTGVFNTSLLSGILAVGDSLIFKVWTIINEAGTINVYTNSSINVSGLSYALWGDVVINAGVYYRTGYSFVADNYNSALFTSTDKGKTWNFKSIIARGTTANNHIYNEAGLFYIGSGDFVAVVRDDYDGNGDNALYIVKSLDFGATWDTPTLLPSNIRGRQPKLTRINTSNHMALTISKRIGTGGENANESVLYGNRTGVQLFISADNGVTWGNGTMIDTFYSTDGGQPWALSYTANRLFIPYYARKSEDEGPDIYSVSIDTTGLEL